MDRQHSLIMGKNSIFEVLSRAPARIIKVYTSQKSEEDPFYQELVKKKVPLQFISKSELMQMVHSESHQGYVASVRERENVNIRDFLEKSKEKTRSLVLMVDSIYDPQNLGAIIRAGECFGVDLVIFSKNRGSDITPVVTKTSAGATELLPIAKVSNLVETMSAFQKAGYWSIAAEVREGARSLYEFEPPEKSLLIFGSEGSGIQPLLGKKSDFYIYVPMRGQIDSLNVSQAAAVFLSYMVCRGRE